MEAVAFRELPADLHAPGGADDRPRPRMIRSLLPNSADGDSGIYMLTTLHKLLADSKPSQAHLVSVWNL